MITLAATFLDLHATEHPTTHVPTEVATAPRAAAADCLTTPFCDSYCPTHLLH